MAAWRPASVVIGNVVKIATMMVVTAIIANHFGEAATLAKVSRGDVMMPMKRAGRLFAAGGAPATVGGVVMDSALKAEIGPVQGVRERPIVPRTYTICRGKRFPGVPANPHAE